MFIKTENGIYNLNHFDALVINKDVVTPRIDLIKYFAEAPNIRITVGEYDSLKEAQSVCDAVAKSLDYSDEIVYLCDNCDDENDCEVGVSYAHVNTKGINCITFNDGIAKVYPKSGEPYHFNNVEYVTFK